VKTGRKVLIGLVLGLLLTVLVCGTALAAGSPTKILMPNFYAPIVEKGKGPPGYTACNPIPPPMPIIMASS